MSFSEQRTLREHFGCPAPLTEHRAWPDVEVLSKVLPRLLEVCAAPSLQHFMVDKIALAQQGSASPNVGLISDLMAFQSAGVA